MEMDSASDLLSFSVLLKCSTLCTKSKRWKWRLENKELTRLPVLVIIYWKGRWKAWICRLFVFCQFFGNSSVHPNSTFFKALKRNTLSKVSFCPLRFREISTRWLESRFYASKTVFAGSKDWVERMPNKVSVNRLLDGRSYQESVMSLCKSCPMTVCYIQQCALSLSDSSLCFS